MATEIKPVNTSEGKGKKLDLWLKVIPIVLTATGLFFAIYKGCLKPPNKTEEESWTTMKKTYGEITDLAGKISAAKANNDDSLLKKLSVEFNSYYFGKMRNAHPRVESQMLMVKRNLNDALQKIVDYYYPDLLERSCLSLVDSIKLSIAEGDKRFQE
jgi:hypothetical protein